MNSHVRGHWVIKGQKGRGSCRLLWNTSHTHAGRRFLLSGSPPPLVALPTDRHWSKCQSSSYTSDQAAVSSMENMSTFCPLVDDTMQSKPLHTMRLLHKRVSLSNFKFQIYQPLQVAPLPQSKSSGRRRGRTWRTLSCQRVYGDSGSQLRGSCSASSPPGPPLSLAGRWSLIQNSATRCRSHVPPSHPDSDRTERC